MGRSLDRRHQLRRTAQRRLTKIGLEVPTAALPKFGDSELEEVLFRETSSSYTLGRTVVTICVVLSRRIGKGFFCTHFCMGGRRDMRKR